MSSSTQSAFATRQTPRLQNTAKTAVSSGWGLGFPSNTASNGAAGFGSIGLGNGLGSGSAFNSDLMGTNRPAQLSGFAQVMGGGSTSNSIDMR